MNLHKILHRLLIAPFTIYLGPTVAGANVELSPTFNPVNTWYSGYTAPVGATDVATKTGGGGGLSAGYGTAIAGGLQAVGSIYAAYMAAKQAKAQREAEKKKHNADTRLNVAQYNINQNRLAGLSGVASGRELFERKLAYRKMDASLKQDQGFIDFTTANYNGAGLNAPRTGPVGGPTVNNATALQADNEAFSTAKNAYMLQDEKTAKAYHSAGLNGADTAYKQVKGKGDYSTLNANNYAV